MAVRLTERNPGAKVGGSDPSMESVMGKRAVAAVLLLLAAGPLLFLSSCSSSTAPSTSSLAVTGTVPPVGQTSQLSAKATLANGTIQDVTATATWSSSNTAVATVTVT